MTDPHTDPSERAASGFKVVDRRRFTPGGEVRPGGDAALHEDRRRPVPTLEPAPERAGAPRAGEPEAQGAQGAHGTQDAAAPADRPQPQRRSQVDFLSFVASLATNAMAALGLLPDGQAQGMPFNPPMAREYIEIIVMLEERTVGNLSAEEAAALKRLIADLRINYVEATRPPAAPPPHPGR
jgi:hypothetical protein